MNNITIVGLGLERDDLTFRAAELLQTAKAKIILRTAQCGAAQFLAEKGIAFSNMDALYDSEEDFDDINRAIVRRLLSETEDILYGVIDLRDRSVRLLQNERADCAVIAGVPVDGVLTAKTDACCQTLSASDFDEYRPDATQDALVREIDTRELAGEVKLRLMERYPEEETVFFFDGDGIKPVALEDLDRQEGYSHRTSVFVPAEREITKLERFGYGDLLRITKRLRAPDGCPWDRAQTHESLRNDIIEEAYEAVDAIDRNDIDALYDEMGDVLLQVALHTQIAIEHGEFVSDDVTSAICRKMIERHEHVFGTAKAETPDEVLALWDSVKRRQRGESVADSMRSIAKSLPSLMRAKKVLKKGMDESCTLSDALDSVIRLAEALREDAREETLKALLLETANVIRLLHADGELLLNRACDEFIDRYEREHQA